MTPLKKTQGKLIRLGQILRILMEKEKVTCAWLSNQFKTTPRTIQRDLLLLKESGFPLHEIQKGTYSLKKDLMKNLEIFDDTELAIVVAIKNIVGQLGLPFQQAADSVLDRLCSSDINMPVFVKIDEPIPLDVHLFNRIIRAIGQKKMVSFQYTSGRKSHSANVEPYRVAYFNGFWYLVGNEIETGIIKRYAMDKIAEMKILSINFKRFPSNLDHILQENTSIWFTEEQNLDVEIMVDAERSHYFKRRKMFPTQKIIEEKHDGAIIVSYRVGNYHAIWDIIKSWIPYVVILKPAALSEKLVKDVKQWVKWQEGLS